MLPRTNMIRSFDVFDTLFARRYVNSNIIWDSMERDCAIEGFAQHRRAADTGGRNLKQIYQAMAADGHILEEDIDSFCAVELLAEKSLIFPIKENLDKVRDGDLLVSDMYMQGPDILNLVRSVGMDKQVTIYQSNGDKATGAFWDRMKGILDLEYHLGDNAHSDVQMPLSRGFNAVHYPNTNSMTEIEEYLISIDLNHLGLLLREIRLRNYEPEYAPFLEIANQKNLLLIFLFCEMLHRKYGNRQIVFLGRDCQLTQRIYNTYYNVRSYYLPFSREVAFKDPDSAVHYLKTHAPEGSVLVDISSTGKTWEVICNKHPFDVEVFIHSDTYWYSKEKPVVPETFGYIHTNSVIGGTSIILEIFNCGDHGKVKNIDVINGVALCSFGETELTEELIRVIHKPVNDAVDLSTHYSKITFELSKLDSDTLSVLSANLLVNISNTPREQLNINGVLDEFDRKEEQYLDNVSN